ncbi:HIT domain-containing protein [Streptomyces sp. H27-D2]|uniref:HIT domain-containing protein n=1 Tax=Streptomyces sp. H27-D2 TaxID=3046304 RepID=UPI002DB57BE3|nr:nucleoside 2-deoxyribosyltransferase domain-containing protein [Streptomyces sp. H27-D2]MEC4016083.1 nucleoside 2-deoxyribosyltransferase domain-containing protein [Streptomyces sp. H27-D2]
MPTTSITADDLIRRSRSSCVFCAIVAGTAPAVVVRQWDDVLAIRPRGGVTDGHVLVIPRVHVADAGSDPTVAARTMACAAELMAELPNANIITSKGAEATQTVHHLHIHVVPRSADDGLPLPWTPQQEAAKEKKAAENTDKVAVVYAREDVPKGPKVFLAGPTPRAGDDVESWRPAAIKELAAQWTGEQPLTVLTPESRGGVRAAHYDDQVGWETYARSMADAILFWIPRDLATMPGFTTNVEFGLDVATKRAVLGVPPDCPNPERNRYLVYVARRHDVPVRETLPAAVEEALAVLAKPGRTLRR